MMLKIKLKLAIVVDLTVSAGVICFNRNKKGSSLNSVEPTSCHCNMIYVSGYSVVGGAPSRRKKGIAQEVLYHAVRQYEDVVNLARYVVMNPVRDGLVKSIRDYPMWDAVWI